MEENPGISKLAVKNLPKYEPPAWISRFLVWFYRADLLEEIEGDLLELFYQQIKSSGVAAARRQYVWNVVRAFRWSNLKKPGPSSVLNIQYDLVAALRHIRFHKTLSMIKVLGLALGIFACFLIALFVRHESNFDLGHPFEAQTYRVVQHTQFPEQMLYWNTTAYPLAAALRADFPDLHLVTQVAGPMERTFSVDRSNQRTYYEEPRVLFADSLFTRVFDLDWVAGDKHHALDDGGSIAISLEVGHKYFGASLSPERMIGRHIYTSNQDALTVSGVFRKPKSPNTLKFDLLVAYDFFRKENPYWANNWSGNYQGTTFLVLHPESNPRDFEQKINRWKNKYLIPEDDKRISYYLQSLQKMHTESRYGNSPGSYIMPQEVLRYATIAALFILLVSILNFINLTTAQSQVRKFEVSVRKVLGGSKRLLIQQFLVENIVFVLLSTLLAFLLALATLQSVSGFLAKMDLQLSFSSSDLRSLVAILLVTILGASIYPAIQLARNKLWLVARASPRSAMVRTFGFRKSLVFFQFIFVQLFVMAAVIVSLQMSFFRKKDLGFHRESVLVTPIPDVKQKDSYRETLLQYPFVQKVAFGSGPPMNVDGFALGTTFRLPGQAIDLGQEAEMKIGDPAYLELYQLDLLAGRNFRENRDSFDAFIVNETLVEALNWEVTEAVGKNIAINEGEATIIGVVADYHNNSLQDKISPCVLLNWNYFLDHAFIQVAASADLPLQDIEASWKKHFPASVFSSKFLDQSIEREYHLEQSIQSGIQVFSLLVIAIACLGIFGLMMFITQQRQKEVSVRKLLGATVLQILHLFNRELIWMILGTFILTVPIAYWTADFWLANFAHHIPLRPWMFLLAGFVTLAVAILTSSMQTLKTAQANPSEYLKD